MGSGETEPLSAMTEVPGIKNRQVTINIIEYVLKIPIIDFSSLLCAYVFLYSPMDFLIASASGALGAKVR